MAVRLSKKTESDVPRPPLKGQLRPTNERTLDAAPFRERAKPRTASFVQEPFGPGSCFSRSEFGRTTSFCRSVIYATDEFCLISLRHRIHGDRHDANHHLAVYPEDNATFHRILARFRFFRRMDRWKQKS